MKIRLNSTSKNRAQITSVRSQITDTTTLKNFDVFIATNKYFDFNNEEHVQQLTKDSCDCDITIAPTIETPSQK